MCRLAGPVCKPASLPKPAYFARPTRAYILLSSPTHSFFFFLIISTLEVHMLSKAPLRKKRNFKNLTLENSPVVVQAADGSPAPTKSGKSLEEYSKFCERLSDLEIGLELRLDLRSEDFSELDELGRGNGGTVCKVLHVRTKTIMAKKVRWTNQRRNEHLRAEPA